LFVRWTNLRKTGIAGVSRVRSYCLPPHFNIIFDKYLMPIVLKLIVWLKYYIAILSIASKTAFVTRGIA
ncbi:MAG: hypothetical protein WBF05_03630, partial [Anaerolineales bacterium]